MTIENGKWKIIAAAYAVPFCGLKISSIMTYYIIPFDDRYRDDAIFCLLSAKNALGRIPKLNADLLDIEACYFAKGDMFWLAID